MSRKKLSLDQESDEGSTQQQSPFKSNINKEASLSRSKLANNSLELYRRNSTSNRSIRRFGGSSTTTGAASSAGRADISISPSGRSLPLPVASSPSSSPPCRTTPSKMGCRCSTPQVRSHQRGGSQPGGDPLKPGASGGGGGLTSVGEKELPIITKTTSSISVGDPRGNKSQEGTLTSPRGGGGGGGEREEGDEGRDFHGDNEEDSHLLQTVASSRYDEAASAACTSPATSPAPPSPLPEKSVAGKDDEDTKASRQEQKQQAVGGGHFSNLSLSGEEKDGGAERRGGDGREGEDVWRCTKVMIGGRGSSLLIENRVEDASDGGTGREGRSETRETSPLQCGDSPHSLHLSSSQGGRGGEGTLLAARGQRQGSSSSALPSEKEGFLLSSPIRSACSAEDVDGADASRDPHQDVKKEKKNLSLIVRMEGGERKVIIVGSRESSGRGEATEESEESQGMMVSAASTEEKESGSREAGGRDCVSTKTSSVCREVRQEGVEVEEEMACSSSSSSPQPCSTSGTLASLQGEKKSQHRKEKQGEENVRRLSSSVKEGGLKQGGKDQVGQMATCTNKPLSSSLGDQQQYPRPYQKSPPPRDSLPSSENLQKLQGKTLDAEKESQQDTESEGAFSRVLCECPCMHR